MSNETVPLPLGDPGPQSPAPGQSSAATEPRTAAPAAAPTAGTPHVVAFDLETTGLDPERARIVEFCFIELDPELRELSRWSELVHPRMPIPEETVRVHGITDGMVLGKPTFK